jgi:hypothetical protein
MTSAEGFCCPDGTHWSVRTPCCGRWHASAKIPPSDQHRGLLPFPGVVLSLPCTPPAPHPLVGLHSLVDGGYQKRGLRRCRRSKTNTRESCHRRLLHGKMLVRIHILIIETDLPEENANSTVGMIQGDEMKLDQRPIAYFGSASRLTKVRPIPIRHCIVMATHAIRRFLSWRSSSSSGPLLDEGP